MNHAPKRYNHKSPNNIYGISPVRSDGNPAVKIEGGRGSAELSLHCIDSEFPSNFDVVPYIDQILKAQQGQTLGTERHKSTGNDKNLAHNSQNRSKYDPIWPDPTREGPNFVLKPAS